VIFNGNHYVFLPYKIKSQTTKVTLASTSIEQYSKLKPTSQVRTIISLNLGFLASYGSFQSDKSITYGPYSDVAPFSTDELTVHFENNNPFLVVSRFEALIFINGFCFANFLQIYI